MTAFSASTGNKLHWAGISVDTGASNRSLGRPLGHDIVVECLPGVVAFCCSDKSPSSNATWRVKGLFLLPDSPLPSDRKIRARTQDRNLETGPEAKAVE